MRLNPFRRQDKAKASGNVAIMVPTWDDNQAVYPDHNLVNYHKDGYTKNELIYACIEATANSASSTSLRVQKKKDQKVVPDHPLRQLLDRPNPYMSEFDFWAMTIIFLRLAGVSYWLKWRSGAGLPVQLWPVRPDYLSPVRSSKLFIDHYEYAIPGMQKVSLDAADLLCFMKRDPLNLYDPVSPIKVLSRSGDVDNRVTDYLDKFFAKAAMPYGVFKSKLKLTQPDIDRIVAQLIGRYGGYDNWHKPVVIDSDAEYQRVGLTFKEMGFETLDDRNEARICAVLDVPPIIVGARVGLNRSTFANYGEARLSWWEDKLFPLYKMLSDGIDMGLAPEFGEDIESEWDFSKVPALQEKRNAQWDRAIRALQAGAITLNQFNKEVGLETVPDGDVYLRSRATVVVPDNSVPEPAQPPPVGQGSAADPAQAMQDVTA